MSAEGKRVDRLLRERVVSSLSPARKLELAEKESREILALHPGYALHALKKKFPPPGRP